MSLTSVLEPPEKLEITHFKTNYEEKKTTVYLLNKTKNCLTTLITSTILENENEKDFAIVIKTTKYGLKIKAIFEDAKLILENYKENNYFIIRTQNDYFCQFKTKQKFPKKVINQNLKESIDLIQEMNYPQTIEELNHYGNINYLWVINTILENIKNPENDLELKISNLLKKVFENEKTNSTKLRFYNIPLKKLPKYIKQKIKQYRTAPFPQIN